MQQGKRGQGRPRRFTELRSLWWVWPHLIPDQLNQDVWECVLFARPLRGRGRPACSGNHGFSVSLRNKPPGANFTSQCPILLLLTERNSKATYLEGHYGKQLHPWTLNYFRASFGRCKHSVTLISCYTKGHRHSWCKTMKFSIRFHLSSNFAKGREKQQVSQSD